MLRVAEDRLAPVNQYRQAATACTNFAKTVLMHRSEGLEPARVNRPVSANGTVRVMRRRQLQLYIGDAMGAHANAIRTYIRAKDENRPHLMPNAFTPDANLAMRVEADNISFPPASE